MCFIYYFWNWIFLVSLHGQFGYLPVLLHGTSSKLLVHSCLLFQAVIRLPDKAEYGPENIPFKGSLQLSFRTGLSATGNTRTQLYTDIPWKRNAYVVCHIDKWECFNIGDSRPISEGLLVGFVWIWWMLYSLRVPNIRQDGSFVTIWSRLKIQLSKTWLYQIL